MIKLITESISIAINGEFGDDYTIYDESIAQGLTEPCFFVQCLEGTNNQFLGKRYYREQKYYIQYFPKSTKDARSECEAVAERLYDVLDMLPLHDDQKPLGGKNMRHNIVDGVLNFFVNYDLFMLKKEQLDMMESLDVSITDKKGN